MAGLKALSGEHAKLSGFYNFEHPAQFNFDKKSEYGKDIHTAGLSDSNAIHHC